MIRSFLRPVTIYDACQQMRDHGENAVLVAGATHVVNELHRGLINPSVLVDIYRLNGLDVICMEGEELMLGSLVTISELIASSVVRQFVPALCQAAQSVGGKQRRNRGTLGGSIVHADPGDEILSVLSAFDCCVVLKDIEGERVLDLREFISGIRQTTIRNDEILTEVRIRLPERGSRMSFRKVSRRNASSSSVMNLTCLLLLKDNRIVCARLALGSVLTKAHRMSDAEVLLAQKKPSRTLFEKAGSLVLNQALQEAESEGLGIVDSVGSYKFSLMPHFVAQVLTETWERKE